MDPVVEGLTSCSFGRASTTTVRRVGVDFSHPTRPRIRVLKIVQTSMTTTTRSLTSNSWSLDPLRHSTPLPRVPSMFLPSSGVVRGYSVLGPLKVGTTKRRHLSLVFLKVKGDSNEK